MTTPTPAQQALAAATAALEAARSLVEAEAAQHLHPPRAQAAPRTTDAHRRAWLIFGSILLGTPFVLFLIGSVWMITAVAIATQTP
jgi:hypothetical protein